MKFTNLHFLNKCELINKRLGILLLYIIKLINYLFLNKYKLRKKILLETNYCILFYA